MPLRYSAAEVLRDKDFAAYTHAEFVQAQRMMAGLRLAGELRRSRRWRPGHGAGAAARPAAHGPARRWPAAASRSGGPGWRPRSGPGGCVLLCDVSGSMEPYARGLLRFLHAAVVGRGTGRVEAFAVGTRLTRLTRELAWRDPDEALRPGQRGGGRLVGRDPPGLGAAGVQRRLRRAGDGPGRGRRDPLRRLGPGRPGGAGGRDGPAAPGGPPGGVGQPAEGGPRLHPLAQGMAAALPHVDQFVAGHSLRALEDLVSVIGGKGGIGAP